MSAESFAPLMFGGLIVTMLIGIAGAILGGFLGRAMGLYAANEPAGFFMAFIGAVLLLFLYRTTMRHRTVV